jgi:hypothetical protein
MRWKETEKKEMNEAVMADRGRGMEWYEGLTIFAFVALCAVHSVNFNMKCMRYVNVYLAITEMEFSNIINDTHVTCPRHL